jgi:hypothetical protein
MNGKRRRRSTVSRRRGSPSITRWHPRRGRLRHTPACSRGFARPPFHGLSRGSRCGSPDDRRGTCGRGYATGGFVANLTYTARTSGLDRGFMVYRDHPFSIELFLSSSSWMRKTALAIRPHVGVHGPEVGKSAAEVNGEFLSWLPSDGRPFFAFLNFFDAHTPFKLEAHLTGCSATLRHSTGDSSRGSARIPKLTSRSSAIHTIAPSRTSTRRWEFCCASWSAGAC